jgi:hypothetical protein
MAQVRFGEGSGETRGALGEPKLVLANVMGVYCNDPLVRKREEAHMAVVPGFEHDMFVSYAHQDNEPAVGHQTGWVKTLVLELEREVRRRLGRKEFDYWMDYKIDENRPLSDEIVNAVQKSATFLVVMSPTYLNSTWCRRERNKFLQALSGRVERGDIFIVEQLPIDHDKYPPEFGNPKSFKFWVADPMTDIARPVDIGVGAGSELAEQYSTSVVNLSVKIAKHIDLLIKSQLEPKQATAIRKGMESAPCVYVARTSEDLEDREEELKAYLDQMGVRVLPETRYPPNAIEFEKAMLEDIARSKVYVQLLSEFRGRKVDFAPGHRYASYQHEIAARGGKPMLLWRDRGLDISTVEDADHRALLEKAMACGIEEFKRAVADEARRPPPTLPPKYPKVMVFVDNEAADRELARSVGKALYDLTGAFVFYPLPSGTPEQVRTDLEEKLRDCNGLLLIYGKTSADWIQRQLLLSWKAIAQRDRPLNALAVYQGPPPDDKGDVGVEFPDLMTLDCRRGIDLTTLKKFVDTLQPEERGQ